MPGSNLKWTVAPFDLIYSIEQACFIARAATERPCTKAGSDHNRCAGHHDGGLTMATVVTEARRSATSTRWIQLVLGLIAMMSISSPQYVWTLFTKPLQ